MNIRNIVRFVLIITLIAGFNSLLFSPPQNFKIPVSSVPEGAKVYVGNNPDPIGVTPFISQMSMNAKYELTFKKSGFHTKKIVYVCDGSPINVILQPEQQQNSIYRLQVNSNISGAVVYVNGDKYGYTPYTGKLDAGEYKIKVTSPGYRDYNTKIYLNSDQTIYANLEPLTLSYKLSVNSNINGADVYINGSKYGNTPMTAQLQGGSYSVKVEMNGYRDFNTTVNLNSDQTVYANLEALVLSHTLTVNSNINGADVYINGSRYGNTPMSVQLQGGNYSVKVTKNGYRDFTSNINLNSNQTVYANLEANLYKLTVNSNISNAEVLINGSRVGNTPFTTMMSPGTYSVKVRFPGAMDYEQSVNLNSDQTIYANLNIMYGVNIKLPKGAQVYINNDRYDINWRDNDDAWKIFSIKSSQEYNMVKIKIHGLEVERKIKFDNGNITLFLDLKNY